MKSPIDTFFSLGEKVTNGDPKRKADFDYYMMWIIFLAFFSIFIGNLYEFFFISQKIASLGWASFGLAIMWFQFFNLKNIREMRKIIKRQVDKPREPKELNIESPEEMLKMFKK